MTNKDIRELGLLLLDDENGINEKAYDKLAGMLADAGCQDILSQVDAIDGCFYIGEDFAEEQLENLNEWESQNNEESQNIGTENGD